jgi:hypothetical protein
VALKDNIHTIDMPTTGGALAFVGFVPPYEATVTKNLREAGAIIIAKTAMTELANWVATGLDNVFVNAKWIFRVPGAYTLPLWKIQVARNFNSRGGYPFEPYISVGRINGASSATMYLDPIGNNRLPSFKQFEMKVDKPFTFRRVKATVSMDVFNMFDDVTTLAVFRQQNSKTANNIANVVAPRVLRFGVRFMF